MVAHLIGQTVSMCSATAASSPSGGDGVHGIINTAYPVLVLTVGLATNMQIETLPVENTQGETLTSKKIMINELTAMFYLARGGMYGQDFDHLNAWNQRLLVTPAGLSTPLYTGPAIISVQGSWEDTGQICIQHQDPIPFGISALTPTGFAGN